MVTRADKSTNSRPQDLYIALTTAIETHTGEERRLQLIGQINDSVFVYDDYAHHPTAVREVLAGVKQVRITFPKSQHCLLPLFEYSRKVLACLPIVQSTLFAPSVYENITKD
jgi:UDP-N-acetylmuramate-alanine ligase